ncbi:hypothetical protein D9757_013719 [Collybiopsis confluens]|uniref:TPR-like protein n=1 Tax=Collybiopsis confluens TaxID=2823264 RepID=A0A8H5CYM5_9AGAR|nr:hypothetical protein D9757_013719 [Collybiopsis confluens]
MKLQVPEGKTGLEVLEIYLALSQWPILIALDNFETPWNSTGNQSEVINFIDQLLDHSNLFVILTMRAGSGPGNKHWIKLGGNAGLPRLELNETRHMFLSLVHSQRDDSKQLDWILNELDGMPLAVLIAQLEKLLNLGLKQLGDLWRKHKTEMLKNGTQNETRLTSVNVSIELSLQMAKKHILECNRLLPVLSYLPNGLPGWSQHIEELFQEDDSLTVVMSIKKLLDFALVYQESDTLKFVLPIREYIQREYPAERKHLNGIGAFYVNFVKKSGPKSSNGQNILERHLGNIVKILSDQLTAKINDGYLEACTSVVAYEKFYPITVSLIDIVAKNKELNHGERIEWMLRKVNVKHWIGKNGEAKEEIRKMQVLLEDDTYILPLNLKMRYHLRCFQELAKILYLEDEYSEAKTLLLKTESFFEQTGDRLGQAQCMQSLGDICMMENDYSEARTMLLNANIVFEQIGNQLGQAQCLQSLGDICRMENNYSEARTMLSDAKATFEQFGNQLGSAQCLQSLGVICGMKNNYSEARSFLSGAKVAYEQIGDQLGEAQCQWSLGDIYRMENDTSEARAMLLVHPVTQYLFIITDSDSDRDSGFALAIGSGCNSGFALAIASGCNKKKTFKFVRVRLGLDAAGGCLREAQQVSG